MEWAEEWGIGELGLTSQAFWSLTFREFEMKRLAFVRKDNRHEALVLAHLLGSVQMKKDKARELQQQINVLRRYPMKKWLESP